MTTPTFTNFSTPLTLQEAMELRRRDIVPAVFCLQPQQDWFDTNLSLNDKHGCHIPVNIVRWAKKMFDEGIFTGEQEFTSFIPLPSEVHEVSGTRVRTNYGYLVVEFSFDGFRREGFGSSYMAKFQGKIGTRKVVGRISSTNCVIDSENGGALKKIFDIYRSIDPATAGEIGWRCSSVRTITELPIDLNFVPEEHSMLLREIRSGWPEISRKTSQLFEAAGLGPMFPEKQTEITDVQNIVAKHDGVQARLLHVFDLVVRHGLRFNDEALEELVFFRASLLTTEPLWVTVPVSRKGAPAAPGDFILDPSAYQYELILKTINSFLFRLTVMKEQLTDENRKEIMEFLRGDYLSFLDYMTSMLDRAIGSLGSKVRDVNETKLLEEVTMAFAHISGRLAQLPRIMEFNSPDAPPMDLLSGYRYGVLHELTRLTGMSRTKAGHKYLDPEKLNELVDIHQRMLGEAISPRFSIVRLRDYVDTVIVPVLGSKFRPYNFMDDDVTLVQEIDDFPPEAREVYETFLINDWQSFLTWLNNAVRSLTQQPPSISSK